MSNSRKKNQKKRSKKGYSQKKRTGKKIEKKKSFFSDIQLFLSVILTSLVILSGLFCFFYSIERVDGYGMLPSLRDKDRVIVKKRDEIKRFDVVYVDNGLESGFRRVIGLPGEKIEMKDDTLFINNEPIDEKYLVDKINEYQISGKNFTENFSFLSQDTEKIPKEHYLVLGDNRPYTTDSRDYGLLSSEKIKGKATVLLFPLYRSKFF